MEITVSAEVEIERYGRAKQSWLATFLDRPHGIPSHDTFGRVIGALDPQALEVGFLAWVGRITESLGEVEWLNDGRHGAQYSPTLEQNHH